MKKSITLIQPRHSYAPDTGIGHIYMPNSLMTIGAQMHEAGYDVDLYDLNIEKAEVKSNIVGINLLAGSHISEVQNIISAIRQGYGNDIKVVLGGQILAPGRDIKHQKAPGWSYNTGITSEQFHKLFGHNVYNGMVTDTLLKILDIPHLPAAKDISLSYMYNKIGVQASFGKDKMIQYMQQEMPLYVSQGCAMNCSFCAAMKGTPEEYRDPHKTKEDFLHLLDMACGYEISELSFYMTNLDVFQSPKKLFAFAKMIQEARAEYPYINVKLRWLAWVSYFNKAYNYEEHGEYLIEELKKAWFTTVWFGIDGVSREVWRWINKPQNTEKQVLDALENCKKANLTPEALMVFGHPVDTEQSLTDALHFMQWAQQEYGAIPRPHVARSFFPHNDGWNHPDYKWAIDAMMQNPKLFQALDFTALPSYLTHFYLTDKQRDLLKNHMIEMTKIPGNTTQLIESYDVFDLDSEIEAKRHRNMWKYDR